VENSRTPLVHFNNKSAYGVVASCLEALTNVEGDWKREMRFLRDAARILASYREHEKGPMPTTTPINIATVEMWEKISTTTEGADVTIVCQAGRDSANDVHADGGSHPSASSTVTSDAAVAFTTGDGTGVEIKAHSLLLKNRSKVLRAMLSTSFREGSSDGFRVEVDCDPSAMKLILELVYVGEEVDDAEPLDVLLSALSQAHQWDISDLVQLLEAAAVRKLDDDGLGRALEVACRLQLTDLQNACIGMAKGSAVAKKRFKLAEYPTIVMEVLTKTFGESEEMADDRRCKRRRVACRR